METDPFKAIGELGAAPAAEGADDTIVDEAITEPTEDLITDNREVDDIPDDEIIPILGSVALGRAVLRAEREKLANPTAEPAPMPSYDQKDPKRWKQAVKNGHAYKDHPGLRPTSKWDRHKAQKVFRERDHLGILNAKKAVLEGDLYSINPEDVEDPETGEITGRKGKSALRNKEGKLAGMDRATRKSIKKTEKRHKKLDKKIHHAKKKLGLESHGHDDHEHAEPTAHTEDDPTLVHEPGTEVDTTATMPAGTGPGAPDTGPRVAHEPFSSPFIPLEHAPEAPRRPDGMPFSGPVIDVDSWETTPGEADGDTDGDS